MTFFAMDILLDFRTGVLLLRARLIKLAFDVFKPGDILPKLTLKLTYLLGSHDVLLLIALDPHHMSPDRVFMVSSSGSCTFLYNAAFESLEFFFDDLHLATL